MEINGLRISNRGKQINPTSDLLWYEFKQPCPICGHDDWCVYCPETNTVRCERVINDYGRPYHKLEGEVTTNLPEPKKTYDVKTASDKQLDVVYRIVLQELGLAERTKQDLLRRGLTEEAIAAKQYASVIPDTALIQWDDVFERAGYDKDSNIWRGVPGFSKVKMNGEWRVKFCWSAIKGMIEKHDGPFEALLVPYRNERQEIIGLQIRDLDHPKEDGSKYRWVSTAGQVAGSTVANRLNVNVSVYSPMINDIKGGKHLVSDSAWLTEGGLKGDIITEKVLERYFQGDDTLLKNGFVSLAIAGTGSYKLFLEMLKRMQVKSVIVAFDVDIEKEQVRNSLNALVKLLKEEGYTVKKATWNIENGKGLDDLLNNGYLPEIVEI
ncbi:hypothetical protein JOC36_001459 [Weissella uvarum]|uniref:DUF3854 domain-containing protein n=1 Tax=Weissella uvarum TaxID=1479233 RepID=UPI001961D48F|nr:DUF3854 domain-containing protein [Weissella uvarum]MBM7617866.1 hypothetical protein [Weissella uvarum]MCM0596136.1 DUF3854 domain-containing protein [Weissella uvarum]